jgi:hypothetical protein
MNDQQEEKPVYKGFTMSNNYSASANDYEEESPAK